MSYDPKSFWATRELPESDVPGWVAEYITYHINGRTLLDFGTGNGRKLHLYKGMKVTGYDISNKYKDQATRRAAAIGLDYRHTMSLNGERFDTAVYSKVLLHVPSLASISFPADKIIVWDIDRDDGAQHVFNHDFSKYFNMKDVVKREGQILFHT